jgi:predicted Fe-Mo cluster-binding NifX family protein
VGSNFSGRVMGVAIMGFGSLPTLPYLLQDIVSNEFGHSKTFTILDVEESNVKTLKVIQNPAASLSHGRGPVLAKTLANMKVNMVMAQVGMMKIIVKLGQRVRDVLEEKTLIS